MTPNLHLEQAFFGPPLSQVCELHFDDFSLYFLQSLSPEEISALPAPDSPSAYERMGKSWAPVIELTHNHGTEKDPEFSYHSGNTKPEVKHYHHGHDPIRASVANIRLARHASGVRPYRLSFGMSILIVTVILHFFLLAGLLARGLHS